MATPPQPMIGKELEAFEAGRNIGAEMVQSLREAKAGKTRVAYPTVITARQNSGLSQPISPAS